MSDWPAHGDLPPGSPRTIIAFTSYAGGVGRSTAVANTAWILARAGRRVLVVDGNPHAPGLRRALRPFLTDPHGELGLRELVRPYLHGAASASGSPGVGAHLTRLHGDFAGGGIDLFGPGTAQGDHPLVPPDVEPTDRAVQDRIRDGARVELLSAGHDYVLIDGPAGDSAGARLCAFVLPDVLAVCFTMGEQAVLDAVTTVRAAQRYAGRAPRLVPVAMRVDTTDPDRLARARRRVHARFAVLPGVPAPDVEIPYRSSYAQDERLAVLAERPAEAQGLTGAYERLTAALSDGRVTRAGPVPEAVRARYLRELDGLRTGFPSEAAVLCAPADRAWAEWLGSELAGIGIRTYRVDATRMPDVAFGGAAVLAVVSPHLREQLAASLTGSAGELLTDNRVVAVRIAGEHLPGLGGTREVDIAGLRERDARVAVLDAVAGDGAGGEPGRPGTRYPGRRPEVHNLPPRNPSFTGRAETLDALRDRFATGHAPPCVLHGPPGVGKSQLAVEYAHRFAFDYDIVWWVPAQVARTARQSLGALLERLADGGAGPVERRVAEALDAAAARWLLIYDDADDAGVLDTLPTGPDTHADVLITSRRPPEDGHDGLAVEVFDARESADLLRRRVPVISAADARSVAGALGNHPLTVELAGAWLYESARRLQRVNVPALASVARAAADYVQRIAEFGPVDAASAADPAVALAVEALRDEPHGVAAVAALDVCAFLSPTGVGTLLLHAPSALRRLAAVDPALRDSVVADVLPQEMARYALAEAVRGPQPSLRVHRVIQRAVRARLSDDARRARRGQTQRLLAAVAPADVDADAERYDPVYVELRRHLSPSGALDSDDPTVRRWLVNQVRYLWRTGPGPGWREAEEIAERLLTRWTGRFGSDDELRLNLATQLANVHRSVGDNRVAYELDRDTLARQRRTLGKRHPRTLMTNRGYAADLRLLGRFDDAWLEDQTTADGFAEAFGAEHDLTLSAVNNLGLSLFLAGDVHAALEGEERNRARLLRLYGEHYVWTWHSAVSAGTFLRALGEYSRARRLLSEAHERLRAIKGPEDPVTLRAARSLAATHRLLGDPARAYDRHRQALDSYRTVLGAEDTGTQACAVDVAADLVALGEHDRAVPQAGRATDVYRAVFGAEHPFTRICEANLAMCLRPGDRERALTLGGAAVDGLRDRLGAEHPFTLVAALDHANTVVRVDASQARDLDAATHAGYRRVFGADHPQTLIAAANLADSRRRAETGDVAARTVRRDVSLEIPPS